MRQLVARPPFTDGGHHGEGLFLAAGPNVRPGYVQGRLEDVAPTVLALLGVPVPAELDGRPLDLLKGVDVEEGARPVPGTSASDVRPGVDRPAVGSDPETGYTPEEEEEVRRRLEDLGYL